MPMRIVRGLDPKVHMDRWIALFTIVGMCWTGLSFIDSRYVRAEEYVTTMTELRKNRDLFRQDIRTTLFVETTTLRKQIVGDALFELEFKRKSSPKEWTALDEARYQRSLREYQDLEQKIAARVAAAQQYQMFQPQPQK